MTGWMIYATLGFLMIVILFISVWFLDYIDTRLNDMDRKKENKK